MIRISLDQKIARKQCVLYFFKYTLSTVKYLQNCTQTFKKLFTSQENVHDFSRVSTRLKWFFFCAGVVYSGEYDVCDVTLSVYPHRTSLKNIPGHGGNRTSDLWKIRTYDLRPLDSHRGRAYFCGESRWESNLRPLENTNVEPTTFGFPPWPGIFFKLVRCRYTLRVTSQTRLKWLHVNRKIS
jgi:hypothetical protein